MVGKSSLTTRVLCVRHNSGLGPLDSEAGDFFGLLQMIDADLAEHSLSRKRHFYLLSGEALERWALKVACGIVYGRIATKNGTKMVDDHEINSGAIATALLHGRWMPHAGLYLKTVTGAFPSRDTVSVSPAVFHHAPRIIGARIRVRALEFDLIFDSRDGAYPSPGTGFNFRPARIRFTNGKRSHTLVLTWPPRTPVTYSEISVNEVRRRPRTAATSAEAPSR